MPGQLPQRKTASWLVLGFELGLGLRLRLGVTLLRDNYPRTKRNQLILTFINQKIQITV